MNKTTCTLAFLVTLLVTASASAMLVTRNGDTRQMRRAQRPDEDKATTHRVRRTEPKRDVLPSSEVARPEVVAASEKPEPESVTLNKSETSGCHEVVGTVSQPEPEPLTEEFTEYDGDGRLRSIWRGYSPLGEQGTLRVTHVASESGNNSCLKDVPVEFDQSNLTNAVDQASERGNPSSTRWKSEHGYEGKFSSGKHLDLSLSSTTTPDSSLSNLRIGLIVVVPASVKHGRFESWHANGQLAARGNYRHGAWHGEWTWFHENGQVRETGLFDAGRNVGTLKSFYANGLRQRECEWVEGVAQGDWCEWFENGVLAMTGKMQNGQRHGHWVFWTQDGAKLREGSYENGVEMGEWTNWQPPAENLQQIICELEHADEAMEQKLKSLVQTLIEAK